MDYVRRDLILKAYTDLLQREGKIFTTDVTDVLMAVPLEDVAPVRHGKWEVDGHHIRCTNCGEYMCAKDQEGIEIPREFCPNCGAKMDKEGDGE